MQENLAEKLARTLATLSATNRAILRSKSAQDLFQDVCDGVVDSGKFLGTAIFLREECSYWFRMVAASGPFVRLTGQLRFSSDDSAVHGRGLGGEAVRSTKLCISNDVLGDPRTRPWRKLAKSAGVKAVAVVPLVRDGRPIGVLYFFLGNEFCPFDDEILQLMELIAENVSFGMAMFQHEEQRDRVTRMFAALSATNEAMMRAKSRDELLQLVCAAATEGGNFAAVTVALTDGDSDLLRIDATAGPDRGEIRKVRLSVSAKRPEGRGLTGIAFRTRQPCVSNDFLVDPRMKHFRQGARAAGILSGAGFPLLKNGESIGILLFHSREKNTFTPALTELLQRLAENAAFALENFNRAEEKTRADDRIMHLATHDSLTDLPNRAMFAELLDASIKIARRHKKKLALLFIDLDRFKVINDTLGHAAGDALLLEIAGRLRRTLRESDIVARLGGDEFVVILSNLEDQQEAAIVARKLLAAAMKTVLLHGQECRITASIGVALYPDNGEDEQTLTKNADLAMYHAKEEGKNDVRFFTSDMKTQSIERLMLETNLRKALERDEFVLQYQPKIDLRTGQITGVEALLRWDQPDLGMLQPGQFIPLAEETGLIVPIGRWVLKTACEQYMAWRRDGFPPIFMAINLSPRQFLDDQLLHDVDVTLATTGMPPEFLEFEITEGMVMQNPDHAVSILTQIKKRGVRLAMDDFGTGYSSMAQIKRFPIDTLKIDRAFVRDLPESADDKAIADAIISLGKALKLTIVAEGVETAEQKAFLRDHACDEMQGYLFSRPVSAESISALFPAPSVASPNLQPQDLSTSVGMNRRPKVIQTE